MGYVLRCPACKIKIPFTARTPEMCPNPRCDTRVLSDRADDDIVLPFIRSSATSSHDALYRQIETASERRAEIAAERAGVPVSEMSDLKITNLNDTRHEGAVAAPLLTAANSPTMAALEQVQRANPNAGVGFSGDVQQAIQYSSTVASGPEPNRGARMQSVIRRAHAETMGWDKVGDRPANEITNNPGYRRRVR